MAAHHGDPWSAAHHEGVDHGAQDGLQQQQDGAHGALVGDDAVAVADGGLRLDGEQEGRDEAVDVVDARRPLLVLEVVQVAPGDSGGVGGGGDKQPQRREARKGINRVGVNKGLYLVSRQALDCVLANTVVLQNRLLSSYLTY